MGLKSPARFGKAVTTPPAFRSAVPPPWPSWQPMAMYTPRASGGNLSATSTPPCLSAPRWTISYRSRPICLRLGRAEPFSATARPPSTAIASMKDQNAARESGDRVDGDGHVRGLGVLAAEGPAEAPPGPPVRLSLLPKTHDRPPADHVGHLCRSNHCRASLARMWIYVDLVLARSRLRCPDSKGPRQRLRGCRARPESMCEGSSS